jgi:hypothetical protein
VRQWNACGRGYCGQSRDTRDHLEGNLGLRESERLLATPPEHERIAALQSHDFQALGREINEKEVDLLLVEAVPGDRQCVCRCLVNELGCDEPVVDEGIATAYELEPAAGPETLVLFMALDELDSLCKRLLALGLDPSTPAAVISRGTWPDQEVVVADVRGIADAAVGLAGPALVVVGEVVGLRKRLRDSADESQLYFSQSVG